MSDTKNYPLVNVHIHSARGKDVLTVAVPAHEVAVLRLIHGDANVMAMGSADDDIELSSSGHAEYARLQRKYRQPGQADPVRFAFPNGSVDLARAGFDGDAANTPSPQADVRIHKKPASEKKAAK